MAESIMRDADGFSKSSPTDDDAAATEIGGAAVTGAEEVAPTSTVSAAAASAKTSLSGELGMLLCWCWWSMLAGLE